MANQPGDNASVSTLRPKPESMAEFLPLWNKRIAHIEAADTTRARLAVLVEEGNGAPDRLQELRDVIATHKAEIKTLTEQMAALQYSPT